MRLSDYLKKYDISYSKFGKLISISKAQVGKYTRNETLPKIATIKKIETATNNKVKFKDFSPIN